MEAETVLNAAKARLSELLDDYVLIGHTPSGETIQIVRFATARDLEALRYRYEELGNQLFDDGMEDVQCPV